jgi:hypothetical protein
MRTSRISRLTRALAILAALTFIIASSGSALATHTFHKYSVVRDSGQFAYTGVYSTRTDAVPSGLTPGPCTATPFQNSPVYYTQWVVINSQATDWVEMGTGYGCEGQRYWFWGYAWQGTWYPIDTEWFFPLQQNYYDIHRVGEIWYFNINGVNKAIKPWNAVGVYVDAGLESYNGHVNTGWISHWELQRTLSESSWYYWSGTYVAALHTPEMCGQLVSSTNYRTRQAAPGTAC